MCRDAVGSRSSSSSIRTVLRCRRSMNSRCARTDSVSRRSLVQHSLCLLLPRESRLSREGMVECGRERGREGRGSSRCAEEDAGSIHACTHTYSGAHILVLLVLSLSPSPSLPPSLAFFLSLSFLSPPAPVETAADHEITICVLYCDLLCASLTGACERVSEREREREKFLYCTPVILPFFSLSLSLDCTSTLPSSRWRCESDGESK